MIRHYKLHARASADGLVVTEYPVNRVALQAREDFYKFALELNDRGWPLMARGQRTNLASLANSVGDNSPVEQIAAHAQPYRAVDRADSESAQPAR